METAYSSQLYLKIVCRCLAVALWSLLILTLTHWPADAAITESFLQVPYADKPVHFALYFVLGWLTWYRRSPRTAEWGAFLLFAAADELTQPWFARTADLLDWCADGLGLAAALVAADLLNRSRRPLDWKYERDKGAKP
ncbi:MAG: VanZ family protein [Gemmatales bacterium]|nr:VanZ family protein [Gemmatales bacterium]MDW8174261.1 VanZ family protein [Gemmatales bacterium]